LGPFLCAYHAERKLPEYCSVTKLNGDWHVALAETQPTGDPVPRLPFWMGDSGWGLVRHSDFPVVTSARVRGRRPRPLNQLSTLLSCAVRLARQCQSIAMSAHPHLISWSFASRPRCSQSKAFARYFSEILMLIAPMEAGACSTLSHRRIPKNCGDTTSTLSGTGRSASRQAWFIIRNQGCRG
jgi:hypothetical protein